MTTSPSSSWVGTGGERGRTRFLGREFIGQNPVYIFLTNDSEQKRQRMLVILRNCSQVTKAAQVHALPDRYAIMSNVTLSPSSFGKNPAKNDPGPYLTSQIQTSLTSHQHKVNLIKNISILTERMHKMMYRSLNILRVTLKKLKEEACKANLTGKPKSGACQSIINIHEKLICFYWHEVWIY